MKVLIIKPSSLGDVIHALPALRLIKAAQPDAQVHWWIDSGLAGLLENDSDIAGLYHFHRRGWGTLAAWTRISKTLRSARAKRFDLVLDLQGLARSGVLAWLSRGAVTVGVDDPREKAAGFYDIAVRRPSYDTHAVDWYLAVLKAAGFRTDLPFTWMQTNMAAGRSVQSKWSPGDAPWIVINPGARWDNKRWPAEYYGQFIQLLARDRNDLRFVILGAKSERPVADTVARAAGPIPTLNLAGETSLQEMCEWIRLGALMVTNDTGPMHIRAAYGKPLIAPFGPTDPRRTGPYRGLDSVVRIQLPCSPCMRPTCRFERPLACLRDISPETVFESARRLLPVPAR